MVRAGQGQRKAVSGSLMIGLGSFPRWPGNANKVGSHAWQRTELAPDWNERAGAEDVVVPFSRSR